MGEAKVMSTPQRGGPSTAGSTPIGNPTGTGTGVFAPKPSPGGEGPGGTGTGGGNAPGVGNTPGNVTVPGYIREEAYAANLGEVAFEQKASAQILNLKLQEQGIESSIKAGSAVRGLKLEGSPLYQLNAQKERGASAIGLATSQESQTATSIFESNQAIWNQNLSNIDKNQRAYETNMWMSVFKDVMGFATSMLGNVSFPQTVGSVSGSDQYGGVDPGEWGSVDTYGGVDPGEWY